MDNNEFYKELVERFYENKASDKELEAFFLLLKEGKLDGYLLDKMKTAAEAEEKPGEENPVQKKKIIWLVWRRVAVAAAVILIFFAGISYWFNYHKSKNEIARNLKQTSIPAIVKHQNEITPGTNNAILITASGKTIVLDSANRGIVMQLGTMKIVNQDGLLAYNLDSVNEKPALETAYNKMETRRGGQYQLALADGSKVWLNAASSIRFPTLFGSKERTVEITGEAYFEVAKDAARPFKVIVNSQAEVEVLGTHFDINAYDNETTIKTTLLEGRVKISKGKLTRYLMPGQQAQINKNNEIKIVNDIDGDEVVAWKNGSFRFNKATIVDVMKQVERWYDVDVVYQGDKPDGHYKGEVPRSVDISEMLKVLEVSGIHFKIEGRKIIVLP